MKLFETVQSTSKYEGVSWNVKRHQWQVEFDINGIIKKFYFDNEFDATKKSNQLCHKMGISPPNPEICELLNQQVTHIKTTFSLVRFFCLL